MEGDSEDEEQKKAELKGGFIFGVKGESRDEQIVEQIRYGPIIMRL